MVRERDALSAVRARSVAASDALAALETELRAVNETLWDVEDALRDLEARSDFGEAFVTLARAVYHTNDRRAAIKKEINIMTGSALVEEKSYAGAA